MLVTIVIPVYNVAPYIERCLLSALGQTYPNIQIILVDDCGTDNSMNIARRVIDKHPNSHLVTIKNTNTTKVLRRQKYRYDTLRSVIYIFLDSDDEIRELYRKTIEIGN